MLESCLLGFHSTGPQAGSVYNLCCLCIFCLHTRFDRVNKRLMVKERITKSARRSFSPRPKKQKKIAVVLSAPVEKYNKNPAIRRPLNIATCSDSGTNTKTVLFPPKKNN